MNRKVVMCGILFLLGSGPMYADDPMTLEEIVVTAERREESLQDISASVSAYTGEYLAQMGLQDASEIASLVPGVELRENGLFPGYFIRGAGVQTETNDINEQPVGVFIDEVYYGIPSAQRGQLYDIERVEVLRGPQGTMFGRNSPAGVVHFLTNKPTDEFGGYVDALYGSFNQRIVEGAINIPISEAIKARASVKYNKDDGWQEDRFTGENFTDNDVLSGRLQVAFDLSDSVTFLAKLDGMRQRNAGLRYGFSGLLDPVTFAPCSLERVNNQECVAINGYRDPELDPEKIASDTAPLDTIDSWGLSGILNWAISDALQFTSITAYRTLEREWAVDGDASPILIFGFLNFATFRSTDAWQFSQEFRLNGSSDRSNWVLGAYYYGDNRDVVNAFPGFRRYDYTDVDTNSWAVFGQLDYNLTGTVTLIGGLRYTDETKQATQYRNTPTVVFTPELNDSVITGKAAVEWNVKDDLMLYASFSTGFKSGTFQASPGNVAVDPEYATAYEVGMKSLFWDGRGRFNASAYYNNYDDFQATGSADDNGIPVNRLVNVGALEVLGIEGDLTVIPTERLELTLGFSFTNGEISAGPLQASGSADYETREPFFFDGKTPAFLPEYSINAIARYALPVSDNWGSLIAQVDAKYSDGMFLDASNNRLHVQESYDIWGARLLWDSADAKWYGSIFVTNLTDTAVKGWSFDIARFVDNRATIWAQRPRTVGVKVGYRF